MSDKDEILAAIDEHNGVCREILAIVEIENRALVQGQLESGPHALERGDAKRALLEQLDSLKGKIKQGREFLESQGLSGASLDSDISAAIEEGKRLIMKAVALDRENEKILLKNGRLSPGTLPSPEARRPDLVAKTYITG